MRTCIDRLLASPRLTATDVRQEAEYISSRLEVCRSDSSISNDAFLDGGAIEGALQMIANHLDMGITIDEVRELLQQQLLRAQRLEEKHRGMDAAIEQAR